MISYVTGTLGMGKSMFGARKIGRSLLQGKCVICNIKLLPNWVDVVLAHNPYYRFGGKARKRELRDDLLRRFLYSDDIRSIIRAKMHGRGEGRGLMLLDEAHSKINNRNWADTTQIEALEELALIRHRGWEGVVISQHKDNTDAAVRRIAGQEIQMTNWQKMTMVPLLGTPLLPVPLFLALTFRLNVSRGVVSMTKPVRRELFTAGWFRDLYDTFEEYADDSDDAGRIWLPLPLPNVDATSGGAAPALAGAPGSVDVKGAGDNRSTGGIRSLVGLPPDASD